MNEPRDLIRPSRRDINHSAGKRACEEVRRMLAERKAKREAEEAETRPISVGGNR